MYICTCDTHAKKREKSMSARTNSLHVSSQRGSCREWAGQESRRGGRVELATTSTSLLLLPSQFY